MNTATQLRGGRVAVLLPDTGRGIGTAIYATECAIAAGTDLVVAVTLPSPRCLYGWAPILPHPELQHDFALDMMMQLTTWLGSTGVQWDLLPVRDPRIELPVVLRAAGITKVFVHTDEKRWPFSVRALRTGCIAAALARRTDADVCLVRSCPSVVRGTHSQDHDIIPVDGGRRAFRRHIS